MGCTGVERAGRGVVRGTPSSASGHAKLGLGSPGPSGTETSSLPCLPSRTLAGVLPRPGGVSSPAGAGCEHPASLPGRGCGNLGSPLGCVSGAGACLPTSPNERPLKGAASWASCRWRPLPGCPELCPARWKPSTPGSVCNRGAVRASVWERCCFWPF